MPKSFKMSIARVHQFLADINQLENSGDVESAKTRVRDELVTMEDYARGHPDLLGRLKSLKERFQGGTQPPQPPKPPEPPEPQQPQPPPQLTYEQLVAWAREMDAGGRMEYGLRFLKMAASIQTLDVPDVLLAEDLEKRIDVAEQMGGQKEATVLVVGQPSSGKSVMLGALWRFLNAHGDVASVSINNSDRDSIREFFERIMDDKMDTGFFPPGTPPRFNEPIAEFVVDIEPRETKRGWFRSSRTLPKVRLRLVDIAGEQFSSMGDFQSGEVDPFVSNFLYTDATRLIILFVIDKDVVTRNDVTKVDRYFTLVRSFMQKKGMDPGRMGDRVGLVLTKWDKHVDGVESNHATFVGRFPSSKHVFPTTNDNRIFTFSVGREYSTSERAHVGLDFDWDPSKAEVLARRLYRSVAGMEDDPWVNIDVTANSRR